MLEKIFSVNETNCAVYDTSGNFSIWSVAKKGNEKVRLQEQTDLTECFSGDAFIR